MNRFDQHRDDRPLVAVDVGNSRTKLGLFVSPDESPLPRPERMFSWGPDWNVGQLDDWLAAEVGHFRWRIASVNRTGAARILKWLASNGTENASVLSAADLPLTVDVDEPDKVGIDRLANVLAVNRMRGAKRPAIIVTLGTAITVDLVSTAGAFLGGAILPGIATSARALHEFTDLLPLEPMWDLEHPPAALGKTTSTCLQSGLFWGAIGGVRELIARLSEQAPNPEIFVTGGAGPAAVNLLTGQGQTPAILVPHLTLAGIALAEPSG
jgi:type III pantothenate kinase